jgi:hypothetical protein
MAVRDGRPNILAQAVIFNLALARYPVQISVRTLTILTEIFVVFLDLPGKSRDMS